MKHFTPLQLIGYWLYRSAQFQEHLLSPNRPLEVVWRNRGFELDFIQRKAESSMYHTRIALLMLQSGWGWDGLITRKLLTRA